MTATARFDGIARIDPVVAHCGVDIGMSCEDLSDAGRKTTPDRMQDETGCPGEGSRRSARGRGVVGFALVTAGASEPIDQDHGHSLIASSAHRSLPETSPECDGMRSLRTGRCPRSHTESQLSCHQAAPGPSIRPSVTTRSAPSGMSAHRPHCSREPWRLSRTALKARRTARHLALRSSVAAHSLGPSGLR